MENQGQYDFDPEKFDFCIHRRKRNHTHRVKQEVTPEAPKKIKTLLPKTKMATPENTLLTTMTSSIDTPPIVSTPTTSNTDGGKISFFNILCFNPHHILIFAICLLHSTNSSEMIYCKYL